MREAAKKLKLKIEIIDKIVREAVKAKLKKAEEIIKYVREKIVELATDFKCSDVFAEKVKYVYQSFIPDYLL